MELFHQSMNNKRAGKRGKEKSIEKENGKMKTKSPPLSEYE